MYLDIYIRVDIRDVSMIEASRRRDLSSHLGAVSLV